MKKDTLLVVIAALIIMVVLWFFAAPKSLYHGQPIKQFHSWSLAKSLVENGGRVFSTYLPCQDTKVITAGGPEKRIWVEEPPVFHLLAALIIKFGFDQSATLPLIMFLLFLYASFLWIQLLNKETADQKSLLFFLLLMFAPIHLRYSVQFLPDTFSLLMLVYGGYFLFREKSFFLLGFFLLLLSVTTKAFYVIPSGLLLLCYFYNIKSEKKNFHYFRIALKTGVYSLLLLLPFLCWIYIIEKDGILNPFGFGKISENRHSGEWQWLIQASFWGRFITWTAIKGSGWGLFLAWLYGVFSFFKNSNEVKSEVDYKVEVSSVKRVLVFWSLGVIPFWFLIREGNYVHDYYSLAFIFPIALIGGDVLLKSLFHQTNGFKKILLFLIVIYQIGLGGREVYKLSYDYNKEMGPAPNFCDAELGKALRKTLRKEM